MRCQAQFSTYHNIFVTKRAQTPPVSSNLVKFPAKSFDFYARSLKVNTLSTKVDTQNITDGLQSINVDVLSIVVGVQNSNFGTPNFNVDALKFNVEAQNTSVRTQSLNVDALSSLAQ